MCWLWAYSAASLGCLLGFYVGGVFGHARGVHDERDRHSRLKGE